MIRQKGNAKKRREQECKSSCPLFVIYYNTNEQLRTL